MRSSTVQSLPFQLGFPDWVDQMSVVQVFFVEKASNRFNVSSAIERPIMQLEREKKTNFDNFFSGFGGEKKTQLCIQSKKEILKTFHRLTLKH
jgi:hypothetical protein